MSLFGVMKRDFPFDFWLRVFGDFMTGMGRSMLIPFMLIYLKGESGFATWIVTLLTALPQFIQLFSTSWGGVLADQYGRKPIMILSLASSGIMLSLMYSSDYLVVYTGYVLFLIVSNFYRPAAMAFITEIIAPEKQREAFALLRVMANLGFAIGPLIGSLFFFTHRPLAVTGTIIAYLATAGTILFIKETGKSKKGEGSVLKKVQNPLGSFVLLKLDPRLRWTFFCGVFFLMAQLQMFTSFSIIVNDTFQDNGRTVAYLMLINTLGVVLGQYAITTYTRQFSFYRLQAIAIVCSFIGWGILLAPLGLIRFYLIFVVTTIGELFMAATYNAYIASLAQEGQIGRYMSFTQSTNVFAMMLGPTIGALGYDLAGHWGYVVFIWGILSLSLMSLIRLGRIQPNPSANNA